MQLRGPDRGGVWVSDTLTDQHGADWSVEAWIVFRASRPVVGELRVLPASPNRQPGTAWDGAAADVPRSGLERRLLRDVPVRRFPAMLAHELRTAAGRDPYLSADEVRDLKTWFLNYMAPGAAARRPRPRRRAGRDDRYFALLAAAYVERLAAGSTTPVRDLAQARGVPRVAHVRDQLHEARERGLLSKSRPGHLDGHLLPAAFALLNTRPPTPTSAGPKSRTRKGRR